MSSLRWPALLLPLLLLGAGCAAGPNALVGTPGADGTVAGFWLGLWHGIICPIAFIISLFRSDVAFYEVHNNGAWYNLGFLLGVGITMRFWNPPWRRSAPAKEPPPAK